MSINVNIIQNNKNHSEFLNILYNLPVYRHLKRGTKYRYLGTFTFMSASNSRYVDGDLLSLVKMRDDKGFGLVPAGKNLDATPDYLTHVELQNSVGEGISVGDILVVYIAVDDNKIWGRKETEFHDGRFELISDEA